MATKENDYTRYRTTVSGADDTYTIDSKIGRKDISVDMDMVHVSTEQTSSAAHVEGPCVFNGLLVKTNGLNDTYLNVYDSITASGTRILPADFLVDKDKRLWPFSLDIGITCLNGVYVTISGASSVQVLYNNR